MFVIGGKNLTGIEGGPGSARITWFGPNRFEVEVTSNNPAFLAVSVSYMPGWKALDEDGQERMVYQAQLSILGSYINAGDTKLTFVYSPDSYALGKNISLTAALLSALSFVILKRRQLRQEE